MSGFEVPIPGERRSHLAQRVESLVMIDLVGVTHFDSRQRGFRELRLDAQHDLGLLLGSWRRRAQQPEEPRDVRDVVLPGLDGLRIVLDVVVSIRKTKATGINRRDHCRGIARVLLGAASEQHVAVGGTYMQLPYQRREILLGLQPLDALESGCKGVMPARSIVASSMHAAK